MLDRNLVRFLSVCVICGSCFGLFEITPNGYHFKSDTYVLEREETGTFVKKGNETVIHVKGYYKQQTPNPKYLEFHTYYYEADENGFRITGEVIEGLLGVAVDRGISGAGVATLVGGGLG